MADDLDPAERAGHAAALVLDMRSGDMTVTTREVWAEAGRAALAAARAGEHTAPTVTTEEVLDAMERADQDASRSALAWVSAVLAALGIEVAP